MKIKFLILSIFFLWGSIKAFNPYGQFGGWTWPSNCGWDYWTSHWTVYTVQNVSPFNVDFTPHGAYGGYYSPAVGSPNLTWNQANGPFVSPNCLADLWPDSISGLNLYRTSTGELNFLRLNGAAKSTWGSWGMNKPADNMIYIGLNSTESKHYLEGTSMPTFSDVQLYLNTNPPAMGPLLFLKTINNNTGNDYWIFGTTAPLINELSTAEGSNIILDASTDPSIVNELNASSSTATSFIVDNIYALNTTQKDTLSVGGTSYNVYPGQIYSTTTGALASAESVYTGTNSYNYDILPPNIISSTGSGIQTIILVPQNTTSTCAPVYFVGKDNQQRLYAIAAMVNQVVNANSCCCSATSNNVSALPSSNCTYSCPNDQIQSKYTRLGAINLNNNYFLTLDMDFNSNTYTAGASLSATPATF